MTSILILGQAKSGTSVLYSALKSSMSHALTVFDPRQPQQFEFIREQPFLDKLVKVILSRIDIERCDLAFFDKFVFVQRDPRDRLISMLLHAVFIGGANENGSFVHALVALLRQKEAEPLRVSVRDLVACYERYGFSVPGEESPLADLEQTERWFDRYPDTFTIRHEEFLLGELADLSEFLGHSVNGRPRLSDHFSYNEREKRIEVWRDWFTPSDVLHYRPLMSPVLEWLDYPDDWELSANPVISPATSSEYVVRTVERLQTFPNRFDTLRGPDFYSEDFVAHLRSAIDDGSEGAMIELALANLVGYAPRASRDKYLRWISAARRRNNPSALVHWGVALERLIATDHSHTPDYYFSNAASLIGNRAAKRRIEAVRDLYDSHGLTRPD